MCHGRGVTMVDRSWWVTNPKGSRGKASFWPCFAGDGKSRCVRHTSIDRISNNLYITKGDCDLSVSLLRVAYVKISSYAYRYFSASMQ